MVRVARGELADLPAGVWRYRAFLPEVGTEGIVTLGEGGTPLLQAPRLGKELGLANLMIKDESRNPTGSFMDRGSTVLLSLARMRQVKECACVTTGNLGASLAAYCAKANIGARVAILPGTDQGKFYQMIAYGAVIESSPTRPSWRSGGAPLVVTPANPFLLEGEKTTGFEIADDLGWKLPDAIVVPVGTGGHLLMIWQAITQLRDSGLLERSRCRLVGVRIGETPIRAKTRTRGRIGAHNPSLVELGESEPFLRREAEAAIEASGGTTLTADPSEVVGAMSLLARTEGIFAEPSSASVIGALSVAVRGGSIARDEAVVCVITGSGLKDPRAVSRLAREASRTQLREPYPLLSPQVGETKTALMRLLLARPSYGYRLRRDLASSKKMSTASVYQHLSELEEFGLVRRRESVVSGGRERVLYELTRRGSDFLRLAGRLERSDRTGPE